VHIDVVIPAHNEEARIDRTLELYRHHDLGGDVRFLAALDGCSDRTAAVVRRHASADPRVHLTEFPKLGKGGALMEAFRTCTADLIAFVDADAATPPSELRRLVDVVAGGADVAIASRRHPASVTPCSRPRTRRITSAGFAFGIRRLFGLPYRDTQCGAKAMRRRALVEMVPLLSSRDFLIDVDLLVTAKSLGLSVVEVPTIWLDQPGSQLRVLADARRMALSAFRLWIHHRTLPIDRTPSPSKVIDLREARAHLQLEEAERVAT
jgi:glycosyltransferase involved in cell wall biosynthesis